MSADVVRRFFEQMQARDWNAAGACLHPDLEVVLTETRELFRGAHCLAMQGAYPDGWRIEVHRTLKFASVVAAEVSVDHDGDRYWCAGSTSWTPG